MENEELLSLMACLRDIPNTKPSSKQDCSDVVHISIYFDGTGNNKDSDERDKKWSNVARAYFSAEQLRSSKGANYPIYISGVGTPFNGQPHWADTASVKVEDSLGGATGAGGTRRTHLAQSNVNETLRQVLLGKAGQLGGALSSYADKGRDQSLAELTKALGNHRLIKIINLSIFGFSRGAALARAFSNDFLKLCKNDAKGQLTYEGHPIRINFMGLFDTVASFGVPGRNVDTLFDERNLQVPDCVERCVHFIAAHELRFSFPVDLIRKHGKLDGNRREEVFPGSHSDVGGGYLPVYQGIKNNYARIPMREMMSEAVIHGVRMLSYSELESSPSRKALFRERFAIEPQTLGEYQRYTAAVGASGTVEQKVTAHMKALYSAWGTMTRRGVPTPYDRQMHETPTARYGHKSMAREVSDYRNAVPAIKVGSAAFPGFAPAVVVASANYALRVEPETWRLKAWDTDAADAVVQFIGNHVHDSKPHFVMNAEPSSYLRARGMAESSRNVLAAGLHWIADVATSAVEKLDEAARAAQETRAIVDKVTGTKFGTL